MLQCRHACYAFWSAGMRCGPCVRKNFFQKNFLCYGLALVQLGIIYIEALLHLYGAEKWKSSRPHIWMRASMQTRVLCILVGWSAVWAVCAENFFAGNFFILRFSTGLARHYYQWDMSVPAICPCVKCIILSSGRYVQIMGIVAFISACPLSPIRADPLKLVDLVVSHSGYALDPDRPIAHMTGCLVSPVGKYRAKCPPLLINVRRISTGFQLHVPGYEVVSCQVCSASLRHSTCSWYKRGTDIAQDDHHGLWLMSLEKSKNPAIYPQN